ncbi:glutathione reductase [Penicillium cosmopolitanum]|uniref:Glutathione reductase n=1 Tax=Penicillium cosmopolitanum TaxID=1131564 RepID=A0A9X0B476_9EURO|nr:glutathione reductase [Penicillium cosmopolitanum]KAJ5387485.1 glutathione reductase [Penicillium cosmopolitanum]
MSDDIRLTTADGDVQHYNHIVLRGGSGDSGSARRPASWCGVKDLVVESGGPVLPVLRLGKKSVAECCSLNEVITVKLPTD